MIRGLWVWATFPLLANLLLSTKEGTLSKTKWADASGESTSTNEIGELMGESPVRD